MRSITGWFRPIRTSLRTASCGANRRGRAPRRRGPGRGVKAQDRGTGPTIPGLLRYRAQYFARGDCCSARTSRDPADATMPAMRKYLIAVTAIATTLPAASADAGAPAAHWCKQGDPPLYASAGTMCGLAGNMITGYVSVCHESRSCQTRVYSPVSRSRYRITCDRIGTRYTGTVDCKGPANTGIWTRFSALI